MEEKFNVEAVIQEFEALTMEAEKVQIETLKKILEENGETEYLNKHCNLKGRTDPQSFKKCVPVVTHKDIEPYIRRIVNGDKSSILTREPITTMSLSSGTTQGKPKYLPFNNELMENTIQVYKTSFAFRNREYPIGKGKALQFIYSSKQTRTRGGLLTGTATTNVFRNPKFKKTMKAIQTQCCSPDEVIFASDFNQSLYCHLLCGLITRDQIEVVSSTFAHSIVQAFRTFEHVWRELVDDVRNGTLSSRITDRSVRSSMEKVLRADPELADEIYYKCLGLLRCKNSWYGLIREMFPNVKYVHGIMTGSMEPYLEKLRFYAGADVPLLSADYGSSEGWIGANVNPKLRPEMVTFAVLPNIGFYEFIPLKEDGVGHVEPLGLSEVRVDEEYEVVVTNFAGLYRYRLGDIVKVKGFYNSTPLLQFICRKNLILSINIDKNTEKDLQLALESASKLLLQEKIEILDFTSQVDTSSDPGHYVIFIEINNNNNGESFLSKDEIMQACCNNLDRSFVDIGYVSSRVVKTIGALELKILKKGTFGKIMDHFVGLGGAVSQFKTPRCVGSSNKNVLKIIHSNVEKSYFSTAY